MGRKAKEEAIKDLVRLTRPDILMIQETKMEEVDAIQASKFFCNKSKGIAVHVRGASGGLATFWNPSVLEVLEEDQTKCSLALHQAAAQRFWFICKFI